ncbi:MAG TPA: carboxymuconolactone decarboxylase family protein [Alphaproteobacteria bacterium]|nr:carboxymuconolactone decarboxylase family protein [Alphaproteobacteria bacterium]
MATDLFKKGLKVRRAVLGRAYVNKSLASATPFTMPFQELTTEYCWGRIWARPGLSRKTRSFLNLAMLCALNRPHELRLHVRGALNNGITPAELQEVMLHVAIYCGIPASLDGFRVAREVLDEVAAAEAKTKKPTSARRRRGRAKR